MAEGALIKFKHLLSEHDAAIKHFVTVEKPKGVTCRDFADNLYYRNSNTRVFAEHDGSRRALQLRVNNYERRVNGCPPPSDFVLSERYRYDRQSPVSNSTHSNSSTPLPRRSPQRTRTMSSHSSRSTRFQDEPAYDDEPAYHDTDGTAPGEGRGMSNLYVGAPNPGVIVEKVADSWLDRAKGLVGDKIRIAFHGQGTFDTGEIGVKLHSDGGGCTKQEPTLPFHRRNYATTTNSALEQTHGKCENSAKAFGKTQVMGEKYPTVDTDYRFVDGETGDPIFVDNSYLNEDVPSTDHRTLQNRPTAVPYENQTVNGMPNCTSNVSEAVFECVVKGTVRQTTKNNRGKRAQDFASLSHLVQSGNGGDFTSDAFR